VIVPNYWTFTTFAFNRSQAFPSNAEFRNVFANDIQVFDINGDGHLDVVQIYSFIPNQNLPGIPIRILLGDGLGGFSDGTTALFGSNVPLGDAATGVSVADFNGDQRPDLFISQHGYDQPPFPGAQNRLILSSGASGVVDATSQIPQVAVFTHWSTVGDIDGDNDVDIYVDNLGDSIGDPNVDRSSFFLVNDGLGNFTRSDTRLPPAFESGLRAYTSALLFDADRDGDQDLLLGMWGPQAVVLGSGAFASVVLFNDGSGHFTETARSALPSPIFDVTRAEVLGLEALDLNGDSYLDLFLLTHNQTSRYIQVLINNGDGSFRDETSMRLDAFEALPQNTGRYFHLVDVNADGANDLVLQTGGKHRFYLNDGTGHFVALPADFLFTNEGSYAFVPGDFNEDGRLDFFVRMFVNSTEDPNNITEFYGIATWTQPASTTLNGDSGANAVLGDADSETLSGLGGDDVIFGAAGADSLNGGDGDDYLNGGIGEDNLHGGADADTLNGGADNDNLYGDALDTFIGGDGYDTIWMTDVDTAGIAVNLGTAGIERIYATNRADNLDGSGTTVGIVLYGFAGADTLIGGSGSDYIYAGYEAVQTGLVRGGAGYDYLVHDSSSLYTGTLTLNMATLQVEGVFGSARAEVINAAGLSTFATIYTGGGADTVTGSANNDTIFMDNAAASVNAGAGFDYVVYNLFDGSGANFNLAAMSAEGAVGREGNDVLDASGVTTSFVTLYGYGGADTLRGGTGNDYIYMDAADLAGGAVQAGAGYDYLINQGGTALSITLVNHGAEGFFGSSAAETISAAGLATFATIFSGGGADTITGSAQGDSIYITNAVASVNAGAGYDYLVYELFDGSGANFNLTAMNAEGAIGRDGNDVFNASGNTTFATLYGYGGNDTMIGGSGNDAFYGGAGNDTMTGNAGNDSYVLETGWGSDTITDFTVGADRILFRAAGLTSFAQLAVTQSGADTLVSFSGQSVRLSNISAATIQASSFQFLTSAEPPDTEVTPAEALPDTFDFSQLAGPTVRPELGDAQPRLTHAGSSAPPVAYIVEPIFTDPGSDMFDLVERHTDAQDWHFV